MNEWEERAGAAVPFGEALQTELSARAVGMVGQGVLELFDSFLCGRQAGNGSFLEESCDENFHFQLGAEEREPRIGRFVTNDRSESF